jgi:hypothetical protein
MMWKAIVLGAMVTVFAGATASAAGICPHTKVVKVSVSCLDDKCPPGIQAYWATIINRFPYKLYVTYAFRSGTRLSQIIPGGLELPPNSETRQPIGIGRAILPKEEQKVRAGRLRVLECGTDPQIRYKWRRG